MKKEEIIELARKIYHENKGEVTLKYIGEVLGVSAARVAYWKRQYKWEDFKKDKPKASKAFEALEKVNISVQQQAFCHNYIRTFNATGSALAAGFSPKNADVCAYQLLRDPKVKAYLKKLKRIHDIEDYLSTHKVLERHKKIAFADMTQFFDENWQPKPMDQVDGTLIKKITIKKNEFTIELEDRAKSLDFLTKFYKLDPKLEFEKLKNSSDVEDIEVVNIIDDIPKNGDKNES